MLCPMSAGTHGAPDFLGGWPSVFYVCGGLGICWYILWMQVFTSNPEVVKNTTTSTLA